MFHKIQPGQLNLEKLGYVLPFDNTETNMAAETVSDALKELSQAMTGALNTPIYTQDTEPAPATTGIGMYIWEQTNGGTVVTRYMVFCTGTENFGVELN